MCHTKHSFGLLKMCLRSTVLVCETCAKKSTVLIRETCAKEPHQLIIKKDMRLSISIQNEMINCILGKI